MKKTIITLVGLLGASTLFAAGDAQTFFDAKCAMCHIKTMPQDRSKLIAPPLMGVMRHVKMSYPNKQDAVAFIVDYVQNPSKSKAVCMQQKISRFGLMPSQKGNITPKELEEVASWMFDNYPPSNFRGGMQGRMQGANMQKNTMMRNNKGMRNSGMKKHKRLTFEMMDANGDGVITKDEFTTFQNKRMAMMQKKRMNYKNGSCSGMMKNKGMMQKSGMKNRPNFATFDLNKDGYITKNELEKVRAIKRLQNSSAGKMMKNAKNAPSFESMDLNKDGKISPKEFQTFQQQRMMKRMPQKGMNCQSGSCPGMKQ